MIVFCDRDELYRVKNCFSVVRASESHPDPCRTRKLSPTAPMVLCGVHTGEQVTAGKLYKEEAEVLELIPQDFRFFVILLTTHLT